MPAAPHLESVYRPLTPGPRQTFCTLTCPTLLLTLPNSHSLGDRFADHAGNTRPHHSTMVAQDCSSKVIPGPIWRRKARTWRCREAHACAAPYGCAYKAPGMLKQKGFQRILAPRRQHPHTAAAARRAPLRHPGARLRAQMRMTARQKRPAAPQERLPQSCR